MSTLDNKLTLIKFALSGISTIWLVGGAARVKLGMSDKEIKDIDLLIPERDTETLYKRILEKTTDELSAWHFNGSTYFGGLRLKFINDDDESLNFEVDLWTGDVGHYLAHVPTAWDGVAYDIHSGAVIRTAESLGPNKLIDSRPVIKTPGKGFIEHCARQGLII